MPDVTVLISSYNGAATIGTAIASALDQPGIDVQVIVGDDASTDDTSAVAKQYDVEVHTYRKNAEKAATLNKLWKHATGRYVIVLDDDDTFEAGCLVELVEEFDRLVKITNERRFFLYGQTQYYGSRTIRHIPGQFNKNQFYKHNPVCSPILVHRKTVQTDGIAYIEDKRHHSEDWAYMLLLIGAGYKGHPMTNTLVLHYNHTPHERQNRQVANDYAVMREYFGKKFQPL